MKTNYPRTDETTIVDPAYIGKAPKIEIAGISYKLPPDRIRDFLFAVLNLNSIPRESIPKELQDLFPGQTISMPINGDSISIRRTMNETCNRLQFFPDNPDRKYTPGEIMTMKELDSRSRAYFNRCRIVPSAIYEKVFRPK